MAPPLLMITKLTVRVAKLPEAGWDDDAYEKACIAVGTDIENFAEAMRTKYPHLAFEVDL